MPVAAAKLDFELFSNESLYERVRYLADGAPVDLTGSAIYCQFREGGPGGDVLLDLRTTTSGITIEDQGTSPGEFVISATAAQVAGLPVNKHIPYDLVVVQPSKQRRILYGSLTVKQGLTTVTP